MGGAVPFGAAGRGTFNGGAGASFGPSRAASGRGGKRKARSGARRWWRCGGAARGVAAGDADGRLILNLD